MKRLSLFIVTLMFSLPVFGDENLPVLWLEAGKENKFQTIYFGSETDWSLNYGHRTLESGKITWTTQAQAVGSRTLEIKTPPLKSGVLLHAMLLFGKTPYRRVVIAPPEPFADRDDWFARHSIALFDPEKKTSEIFEQNRIPFKRLASFAEIEAVENAVVVVGQDVDFHRERGLAELLFEKSAQGGAVFVSAPKGEVPLDYHPSIHSLNLRVDARSFFPQAVGRRGGGWALRAKNDRLVLATEFIAPYGTDGGKLMGVGPTILDIRFSDNRRVGSEILPRGRILFDKEPIFSMWPWRIEFRYYFKALIEELSKEFEFKGE